MASDNLPAPMKMDERGVHFESLEEAYRYGQAVIESGNAPKGVTRPAQVVLSIQAGAELGFTPSRSLAQIPVINGRATLMGDAALALARQSGLMDKGLKVEYVGDGDDYGCTVTSHRDGNDAPTSHSFTVRNAKQAKLWGNSGPWSQYPDRMLYYRALGFHLRDLYGDVLNGLTISEEVRDYPASASPRAVQEPPQEPDPLLGNVIVAEVEPEAEPEPEMEAGVIQVMEEGVIDAEPVQEDLLSPGRADEPPDDWEGRDA